MVHAAHDGGGGSISNTSIADAAIEADLKLRGFYPIGGGKYGYNTGSMSYDQKAYVVSDGHAEQLGYPDAELPAAVTSVQGEVFDYWPGAIDEVFADYEDLPRESDFSGDASSLEAGAAEIDVTAESPTSQASAPSGNGRLAQDLNALAGDTGNLAGHYAQEFDDRYVSGLPFVMASNHALAAAAAVAVRTEANIWREVATGLGSLRTNAYNAMIASGEGGGDDDLSFELGIAGALIGAVGAFASGGAAIALALASAGAGIASSVIGEAADSDKKKNIPLGASSPRGVLSKIEQALTDIDTQVREQEQELVDLLTDCTNATNAGGSDGNFDLRLRGGNAGPGRWLQEEQDVVVNPTSIAKITELWIPTIAGDLRAARTPLDVSGGGWSRPSHIGVGGTGPWSEYQALQSRLDDLLGQLRTELLDAADSLQAAAQLIGLTDESISTQYEQEAERINSLNINEVQS